MARKEAEGKRKVAREKTRACWTCGKTGHIAAWCRKGGNNKLYAIDEDGSENVEEATDNDEESASVVFVGKKVKMSSGKR